MNPQQVIRATKYWKRAIPTDAYGSRIFASQNCYKPSALPAFLRNALGALAQLVEHLLCKQRVSGSNPLSSTIFNTRKVLSDCFGFHGRYLTSYKEGSSAQRLCADLIWQRLYRQGWALNSKDIVWQLMSVRFVHKTSMDILFLAHGRQTLTVMHPNFWSGVWPSQESEESSVTRVSSGCLGAQRRRKTWYAAISSGEVRTTFDPEISEWGNPPLQTPILFSDLSGDVIEVCVRYF